MYSKLDWPSYPLHTGKKVLPFFFCLFLSTTLFSQRVVIDLNGTWQIEESIAESKIPSKFLHTVQVPGLANQSVPPFPGIDQFYGKEYFESEWSRIDKSVLKKGDTLKTGYTNQKRKYLWYQRSINITDKKEAYLLKINKAQFGTAVWINGKKAGESLSCFTAQRYDITPFIKVPGKNVITIRIGAHPGVLPISVPAGNDFEKQKWTPGIYDDVSIIGVNYPYIETTQVAPDIYKNEVTVQTVIFTKEGVSNPNLLYTINEWKTGKQVSSYKHDVSGNRSKFTITQRISIPNAKLWSPEEPFLYTIKISTGRDEVTTRFGMREFRFDTPTRRAYLNNKIIFLRGSNITLHRFFDDSLCTNQPWNEKWVRKLLTELPKKYHWNTFRFCIGAVPEKWFEMADEAGLIIQNEYFIWSYRPYWDATLLKEHIKDWMRDSWNHASVAWWDINNETRSEVLTEIIHDVRSLDLSNRAWDNGYNLPEGPNDPVEDHHYKFYAPMFGMKEWWTPKNFEKGTAEKSTNAPHPSAHACVLNEYGWLWLKRNGQATLLTQTTYDSIAKGYTNEQRQNLYAYLLAAETEYFRAHRNYAGILHFDYLTGDFNGAITGDIFKNPDTQEPVKVYDEYLSEMFKPLGVYVNFFPAEVKASSSSDISVMLVNDEYTKINGNIEMQLINSKGESAAIASAPFSIDQLSQHTVKLKFKFPPSAGDYWLNTSALHSNGEKTLCRRMIKIN